MPKPKSEWTENEKAAYEDLGLDPSVEPDDKNPFEEHLKIETGDEPENSDDEKEDEATEDGDSEEEVEEEESEEDVEDSEDYESEEEQDDEESYEDTKKDKVSIKKFMKEKSKNRELRKRVQELEDRNLEIEEKETIEDIVTELADEGLDEAIARKLAKRLVGTSRGRDRDNKFESRIVEDLEDLAESDSLFDDALDYKIPIIKRIRTYKTRGIDLDVEDAYMSVVGKDKIKSKIKTADTREKSRKRLKNKREGVTKTKHASKDTKSSPVNYGLDADDRKALKELQRAQPDAKWTAKKYSIMMKNE